MQKGIFLRENSKSEALSQASLLQNCPKSWTIFGFVMSQEVTQDDFQIKTEPQNKRWVGRVDTEEPQINEGE